MIYGVCSKQIKMEETGSMAMLETRPFSLEIYFFIQVRILMVVEILRFALRVSSLGYGIDHWELFSIILKN